MHESIEQCKITEQPTACLQAGGMNCDFIGREPDSEPAKRGAALRDKQKIVRGRSRARAREAGERHCAISKNRPRKEQGESPRSGERHCATSKKPFAEEAGREPAKRGAALRDKQKSSAEGVGREPAKRGSGTARQGKACIVC